MRVPPPRAQQGMVRGKLGRVPAPPRLSPLLHGCPSHEALTPSNLRGNVRDGAGRDQSLPFRVVRGSRTVRQPVEAGLDQAWREA